jgi:ADP-ribose pyrophosphatase YjhB (NUDIX family)
VRPDPSLLDLVRNLQVIAQEGLAYSRDPFDLDRFARLRDLAAGLAETGPEAVALPADPLPHDGPPPVVPGDAVRAERGYLTPKLDVRAAVIDDDGRLLLVRENSDGRWALPGGWADVGETLAEGVVREVREETGYVVEVDRLLGVYDRERWGHPPMLHFTLKSVIACRLVGGTATPSPETTAVEWFARDALPPLSVHRNSPELVARVFDHADEPGLPPDL